MDTSNVIGLVPKTGEGRTFWEVHHVLPKAEGGTDELANLATLCLRCHRRVHGPERDTAVNRSARCPYCSTHVPATLAGETYQDQRAGFYCVRLEPHLEQLLPDGYQCLGSGTLLSIQRRQSKDRHD